MSAILNLTAGELFELPVKIPCRWRHRPSLGVSKKDANDVSGVGNRFAIGRAEFVVSDDARPERPIHSLINF